MFSIAFLQSLDFSELSTGHDICSIPVSDTFSQGNMICHKGIQNMFDNPLDVSVTPVFF